MTASPKRLNALAVSESGFIFDPNTGQAFTTNEIGLEIIHLLKEGKTFEDIVSHIGEHYEADRDLIYKDVAQFWGQMRNYGWLDEN